MDIISGAEGVLLYSGATSSVTSVAGCTSKWSALWVAGLLLYKAPFLVWGLREAWWTRGHILPAINDSACLAFSSITTGVAMLVYHVAREAFPKWPTVIDACALASIWASVMVSIGFVFIPKVRVWRSTPKGERARLSISSISNSMAFLQSFENIETELGHAHTEIDSLKNFIKQVLSFLSLFFSFSFFQGSDDNNNNNDDDDGDDEEDGGDRWSGQDCGQSSSADEGGVTSEEVNSSLDTAGQKGAHFCCLHGSACQAGASHENDKEEGSCWYLPSDRGYAPAHLLASNHRGRHHRHHHHHHRRRRRPGMSAPLGHSFSRRHRSGSASTPTTTTTHASIGHRAASSCGSNSVFTKGSSSNKAALVNNSSMYGYYTKRDGGVPARRHSHGSIYTQQQQQQNDYDLPRRLFDYPQSPDELSHDMTVRYFSLNRKQQRYNPGISSKHHYDSDDMLHASTSGGYHGEHDAHAGSSRQKFSMPKHRKRRRSSTPSVQSASSYTKLSKLRSDLSDAMAISRRLMGMWSVDSAPVQISTVSGHQHRTSTPLGAAKRATPKSTDKTRRQTVIGIQGIADSILESYNFQRTEDNHSFVYDCITPRKYASSPSKIGKTPAVCSSQKKGKEYRERSSTDSNANVFSHNFYNVPNQDTNDFHSLESGLQNSRIELACFAYEDKKLNGFENPLHLNSQTQYNISKIPHSSFGNNINHPPSSKSTLSHPSITANQNVSNHFENAAANPGQFVNSSNLYEKDMSAFYNVRSGYNVSMNVLNSSSVGPRNSGGDSLVFLPAKNVSIQSMLNQAQCDTASDRDGFVDIGRNMSCPNNLSGHNMHIPVSNGVGDVRRSPGVVSESGCTRTHQQQPQQQHHHHYPHQQQQHHQHLIPPSRKLEGLTTDEPRRSPSRSPSRSLASEVCIKNAQREEGRRHSPYPSDSRQTLSIGGLFSYSSGVQCDGTMRRNDSFA
ncbi:gamma-aminobutyric acid type B receptor subunit 2-like [Elysia marginata]|uniref:Gamma-aminobutyric acid type B receptor subunit 2-like n=1 Tax=Elysia marginata TaxID=1093978 RepID=A0AAV4I0J5_9GAST|nr:gamma-aminobutyric acid type B receptor subunit 2-like [Elysia marginata]